MWNRYMVEQGTLELRSGGRGMSQEEAYCLLATPAYGSSWNAYQVFGQLKKFGYIVGRHGVPWTLQENLAKDESKASLTREKLELTFDVHKPSGQFQKAKPGEPAFSICFAW
jgi:tRNA-splicing endonuclease subunit Sen54